MNLPAISLRDLEYLVAVAEHGHFGRAARACHVSQPALSGQVKKAEEILGQTVFERTNRRVSLTDPGRAIVQQAKVVLEEARRLAQLGATRRGPFDGHLSLGAIASVGPYLLPHLLRPLRKHYPQLQLVIKEGLTETLIEDLRAGALDAAIASPTFDSHGLHEFPLFFEPFLLAAPHGHALAKKAKIRTADLDAGEMVLLEDGHCLKDQTVDFCPASRRTPNRPFHAASLETLKQLVATGAGYTLVPLLAARDKELLAHLVDYRPFESKQVGRKLSLYCRESFPRLEDMRNLAQFLVSQRPPGMS